MFGHDGAPSIVYSFGARRPTEGLALVLDQMRGAHRYRNLLVEIERKRRAAVDVALRDLSPALVEAERAVEAAEARLALAREAVKAASREKRGRVEPGNAGREAVTALRAELKDARARRKEIRTALFASEPWQTRQAALDAVDLAARKAARAACGLFSSTYLHVEQSLQGCRRGAPPAFRAWTRRGHLAVQFVGGLNPAELGTHDLFRVALPGPEAYARGAGRKGRRADLFLRVAPLPDGRRSRAGEVTARVPVVWHRPLPADTRIKWGHLLAEHLGEPAERWTVQIVLARERGWAKPDRATGGTVGVDVGWRLLSDRSLRVAVAAGDDGERDAAVLPPRWLADAAKLEDLRSIRDHAHGLARDALAAWILSDGRERRRYKGSSMPRKSRRRATPGGRTRRSSLQRQLDAQEIETQPFGSPNAGRGLLQRQLDAQEIETSLLPGREPYLRDVTKAARCPGNRDKCHHATCEGKTWRLQRQLDAQEIETGPRRPALSPAPSLQRQLDAQEIETSNAILAAAPDVLLQRQLDAQEIETSRRRSKDPRSRRYKGSSMPRKSRRRGVLASPQSHKGSSMPRKSRHLASTPNR